MYIYTRSNNKEQNNKLMSTEESYIENRGISNRKKLRPINNLKKMI